MTLHPYCQKCGWRKGGVDSWNGKACKCGEYAPPITLVCDDLLIGPLPYKRTPGGLWAPDYSHPGVAKRIAAEADLMMNEHWSIDRWRK